MYNDCMLPDYLQWLRQFGFFEVSYLEDPFAKLLEQVRKEYPDAEFVEIPAPREPGWRPMGADKEPHFQQVVYLPSFKETLMTRLARSLMLRQSEIDILDIAIKKLNT